ncbi:hypothetical protein ASG31_12320 [Chryseobacterium sp. Leaf404]|nr:hypothetical protein ASG31_12320 [Chryseobacterium sp. Leaf404]
MVLRKRESRSPPVFIQILNHLFDWGFFCFGAGYQMPGKVKVAGCRVRVSDDRGLGDDFNV